MTSFDADDPHSPFRPGMPLNEVPTPCLLLDLDALERNLRRMGEVAARSGMRLRAHAKMHKSVDVARLQMQIGGAAGICCQKVSEAEVFARMGIEDILVTNQIRRPDALRRLAELPRFGGRIAVCVDAVEAVHELQEAAKAAGTELGCLVEIDCGAARCGTRDPETTVAIARAIASASDLRFEGVQAYQGALQHIPDHADRLAAFKAAEDATRRHVEALRAAGLAPAVVSGGGTGSWPFESASPLWSELQCGSYAFMDADYGRVRDAEGRRLDAGSWHNALFLFTSVMSTALPGQAVCDAGFKSHFPDSGLPVVFGRDDVSYTASTDEHGVLSDPSGALAVNDRLRLVPGHCDPTCNLHDIYVGYRGETVECIWPVSARGRSW